MSIILKMTDCTFSVEKPQPMEILRVDDFSVSRGEMCAVFGPSGSGKTTLFNMIAGLLSPSSGQMEIAGHNLAVMSEYERDRFRGRNIGFVFQSFNLLHGLSALENVLIGMTLSGAGAERERAVWLLTEVGLSNRLDHLPDQLSIGEQQRVAIARALAHRPLLLLADEPTGSLDPVRAAEVMELIISLAGKEGCTLLAISHDLELIERFPSKVSIKDLNRAFMHKGDKK